MDIEAEKELCTQRISLIISTKKQLSDELIELGYPNEYPKKFKDLEKAYKDLKDALFNVIYEELKVLKDLKQPCQRQSL